MTLAVGDGVRVVLPPGAGDDTTLVLGCGASVMASPG